jgi:transposase InsO family protein
MASYFRPPEQMVFNENRAAQWMKFKQAFQCFIKATAIHKEDEDVQVACLLNLVGEDGRDIYSTFKWNTGEDREKMKDVLAKFDAYCSPLKNIVYERYRFFSRNQKDGESIDDYMTELRLIIKTCDFASCVDIEDSLLRDKLVMGCSDSSLKERLLRENNISLGKALDVAHAAEATKRQIVEMNSDSINVIRKNVEMNSDSINVIQKNVHQGNEKRCSRCGRYHKTFSQCPAQGKQCFRCKAFGHFANLCKTSNSNKVHEISERNIGGEDANSSSVSWLSINVVSDSIKTDTRWNIVTQIQDMKVSFKIDSGADVNVIPVSLFHCINKNNAYKLSKTQRKLRAYMNCEIPVKGVANILLEYNGKYHVVEVYVVDSVGPPILGKTGIEQMELLKRVNIVSELGGNFPKAVFSTTPGKMKTEHHIQIKTSANPVAQGPRRFPFAVHIRLKQELDRLASLNLIAPVTQPTPWINQMAIVVKKDESLRLCLDPRELNKAIIPERFSLPTAEEIFSKMQGAKFFSFLDATQGFHHIPLSEESSYLTTFHTPFGRYRWLRLPYGLCSASEVFHRAMVESMEGLEGVEIFIDDLAIYGRTRQEHDERLQKVLERCLEKGIHLNKAKCKFAAQEAKFLGHILSAEGLKPDPDKIKAVTELPTPKSKEELQRFLGMVTYLSKFIPNVSQKTEPLRRLIKNEVSFAWTKEQDEAYQKILKELSQPPTLSFADETKPFLMMVDASQHGLGACLMQEGSPITYFSCSLTNTQMNYAQIEKEMLAIVVGCKKFFQYIWNRKCVIQTDHKPLEYIFKKPLSDVSPRLRRMLMKVQQLNLVVKYTPGKQIPVADHLSRSHLSTTTLTRNFEASLEKQVLLIEDMKNLPDESWKKYRKATSEDAVLQQVAEYVRNGWPADKKVLEFPLHAYWACKEDLYCRGGIIFKKQQIIIPSSLRQVLLRNMHIDHSGISRTLSKAREAVYWPGMNNDIRRTIEKCSACQTTARSNTKEPLIIRNLPRYPFQRVAMDYFEYETQQYLVIIDAYSHWFNLYPMQRTNLENLLNILKSNFAEHGTPEEICSDNGPPFNSYKFKQFCEQKDILHTTSSPRFPQSNGLAERAVQTVKLLIRKCQATGTPLDEALLEHRNSPFANQLPSPSELALGRKLRCTIPYKKEQLEQRFHSFPQVVEKYQEYKRKQKIYYDQGSRKLEELGENENVLVQKDKRQWIPATVINKSLEPRSYLLKTNHGRIWRRNRRQVKKWNGRKEHLNECNMETQSLSFDEDEQGVQHQTPERGTTSHRPDDQNPVSRYGRIIFD